MANDILRPRRVSQLRAGYTTTAQLLDKARRDTDPVSVFVDGESWDDAEAAIFIVKGPEKVRALYDALAQAGMVTPGKPVVR